ncbi:MAG: M28 family metallopeptidase [Allosphingosinicella sp.]|uniref:M28 family metallopeptidase n=1 Tax=Allosphingosinicella sp. TaxID=2823234 RepID=UPI00392EE936
MRKTPLAALALLGLAAAAAAQPGTRTPGDAAAAGFTADAFRAHVEFLADDRLEGREAGSRGYDIGALYVATRFSALGLTPAANGSWYQQVPLVQFGLTDAPARLTIGGRSFRHGEDVLLRQSPEAGRLTLEAPVVFAGYGISDPALGIDDYAGLDVRGKIVAVLNGSPSDLPSDVGAHLNAAKRAMADRAGAVGMVILRGREEGRRVAWSRVVGHGTPPGLTWAAEDGTPYSDAPGLRFVATLGSDAAEALFRGAPRPLARVLAEGARPGARPAGFALAQTIRVERESANRSFTSPNVVAVLPGSDPALAGEYVLMMAHLDGLGMEPHGAGSAAINNGAMDNATGVATLLEVARQMAASGQRPRRSILFAAVTAEEKGLRGAHYLARNPVVDGRVVGVVNLDMPILTYDFQDVIAFGAEHSTMAEAVARAGARMGVRLSPDPLPHEGLFTRSDHYMFVQEGVPAVFLMTGFAGEGERRFTEFLANQYHTPADDLRLPFNWNAGARFAQLNYLIAREIADASEAPRWYEDSYFGRTFGGDRPRAPRAAR